MAMQRQIAAGRDGRKRALPGGVIVPLLTPLDATGRIDERAAECLLDYVLGAGVHGIFILGSTGEGDSLSQATQHRFAEFVASVVKDRAPLLLGAMQPGTEAVIDFLKACPVPQAFRAAVVGVPYYRFLHCEAEVRDHFRRIHEATGMPLVVYNFPHPSSRVLTPDIVARLMEYEGIVGYKDSSGQLGELQEFLVRRPARSDLCVYQGDPALSLASLAIGCDGLIPGTANFIPAVFVELYRAFRTGDAATATRCQAAVFRFRGFARVATPFRASGFHFSTFKAGLDVMGFGGGTPAPPYQALPAALLPRLREYFHAHGVLEQSARVLRARGRRVEGQALTLAAAVPRAVASSQDLRTVEQESPK